VNNEGSGDMYYKSGSMLHMIRQIIGDDELWRSILRGLNEEFRHQTVTGAQVEDYVSRRAGRDLSRIFAQYLTTADIPVLEYRLEGSRLRYRWAETVPGFEMPVRILTGGGETTWLHPTSEWQEARVSLANPERLEVDDDFYVEVRDVDDASSR
jgi:aminopeptidase N